MQKQSRYNNIYRKDKIFNRPNRKYKPKTWSRKGECPSCRVGQGSKHNSKCTFKYDR